MNSNFYKEIASRSKKMERLYHLARSAALSSSNIYIYGEVGSGKDILAEYIGSLSNEEGAFITVDSSILQTSQNIDFDDFFNKARRGTIYFKAISFADKHLQEILLNFLKCIKSSEDSPRVILSSHLDLHELVDNNSFLRELLLYFPLELNIPPLYERKEDIELLIQIFLQEIDPNLNIENDAKSLLLKYRWPGNVRELYNTLLHAKLYAENGTILISSLPKNIRKKVAPTAKSSTLEELYSLSKSLLESGLLAEDINPHFEFQKIVETEFIKAALDLTSGNSSKAAELMHINRNTLASKLSAYGIEKKNKEKRQKK